LAVVQGAVLPSSETQTKERSEKVSMIEQSLLTLAIRVANEVGDVAHDIRRCGARSAQAVDRLLTISCDLRRAVADFEQLPAIESGLLLVDGAELDFTKDPPEERKV
jgi:hypothetical protein